MGQVSTHILWEWKFRSLDQMEESWQLRCFRANAAGMGKEDNEYGQGFAAVMRTVVLTLDLKIRGLLKWEAKHLFERERERIAILELLIQAETQIVFWLGDKGQGYLWESEKEQYISRKKTFLLV